MFDFSSLNYRQRVNLFNLLFYVPFTVMGVGVFWVMGSYGWLNLLPWVAFVVFLVAIMIHWIILIRINRSYLTCDHCGAQTYPLRVKHLLDPRWLWAEGWFWADSVFPEDCPECGERRPTEKEMRLGGWVGWVLDQYWIIFGTLICVFAFIVVISGWGILYLTHSFLATVHL